MTYAQLDCVSTNYRRPVHTNVPLLSGFEILDANPNQQGNMVLFSFAISL
jgi:hypothetical protein